MSAAAAPQLTPEQQQLLQVSQTLHSQERAQIRLSFVGLLGLGLIGATYWLARRRR
jgi:hypothetical protein